MNGINIGQEKNQSSYKAGQDLYSNTIKPHFTHQRSLEHSSTDPWIANIWVTPSLHSGVHNLSI